VIDSCYRAFPNRYPTPVTLWISLVLGAPDLVQKVTISECFLCIEHQFPQEVVLCWRESQFPASDVHASCGEVDI